MTLLLSEQQNIITINELNNNITITENLNNISLKELTSNVTVNEEINNVIINEEKPQIIISSTGSQVNADAINSITSNDGTITVTTTSDGVRDLSVNASILSTLTAQVRNQTGSTLTKGTIVYISGASGNKCLVSKAQANSEMTSSQTFGMIQEDILNNQNGFIVISGIVTQIDTEIYPDGTILYLSPYIAGNFTSTKPIAPNHMVYVGVVTRQHKNQGEIQTRIQNGYELNEIHDVLISNPQTNQILVRDSGLWKNLNLQASQVNSALGFNPIDNDRSIINALIFG